jgi:hypothetical protein
MSHQSEAGKLAWQRRAPGYGEELREQIERKAAAPWANWQARGRLPVWFRIKQAARRAWIVAAGIVAAGAAR